jgi:hypothetical protein
MLQALPDGEKRLIESWREVFGAILACLAETRYSQDSQAQVYYQQ